MPKIYCGNGKEIHFPNTGGHVIEVALNLDELNKAAQEGGFGWTTNAGKRFIKVKICKNRDGEDQYGNTHYAEVNQWKPDPNYRSGGQPAASPAHGGHPPQPAGPGPGSVQGGGSPGLPGTPGDDIPF